MGGLPARNLRFGRSTNISIQAEQSFLLLGTGTNAVTIAANIGPHTVFDLGDRDMILLSGWGSVTYLQNGADVDVSGAGGSLTVKDATSAYVQDGVTAM